MLPVGSEASDSGEVGQIREQILVRLGPRFKAGSKDPSAQKRFVA